MSGFFQDNLLIISIFYALSFFAIFFAIMLQRGNTAHFEFVNTFMYLAGFGLIHGIGDLLVVAPALLNVTSSQEASIILMGRFFCALSFLFLYFFGLTVFSDTHAKRVRWTVFSSPFFTLALFLVVVNPFEQIISSETVYRLLLGLPAAVLTALALLKMSGRFQQLGLTRAVTDFRGAAITFMLYGVFAGLFYVSYPDSVLLFGFPVQLLRALAAVLIAVFTIRILSVFKL
jgi:hypothetical protein